MLNKKDKKGNKKMKGGSTSSLKSISGQKLPKLKIVDATKRNKEVQTERGKNVAMVA